MKVSRRVGHSTINLTLDRYGLAIREMDRAVASPSPWAGPFR